MKLTSIGTVIATRILRRSGGKKVTVEIGKPRRFRGGAPDYYCPFRIRGIGDDYISYSPGVDAFQALELVFVQIGGTLYYDKEAKAAKLTWDAGSVPGDLGLPLMETDENGIVPDHVSYIHLFRPPPPPPKGAKKAGRPVRSAARRR
jgi:hypothetical protein